ncbi:M67 family metallopeptidase [Paenibacillus albidus]|uniref:Mov34/MPN/PAD-1 family protein n=1 Tax=Paenibacillus albidus TaxID=2041023 RepID=UPI001BEA5FED|nr:M67 family metallopeptidase [Paenibacillus albidus]MBT2293004.1 M67 family metallopeptidase [Paenibacillus albidus]
MTATPENLQPIGLKLSAQQALGRHLLACLPHEACGVLVGTAAAGGMRIDAYIPMRNVAPDPLHTFVPHPEDWVRALYADPAPIGLFHSHPHAQPLPSAADLQGLAALGNTFRIYLIGSPGTKETSSPVLKGYYIERSPDKNNKCAPRLIEATVYALLK